MLIWLTHSTESGTCAKCSNPFASSDVIGIIDRGSNRIYAHPLCWLALCLEDLKRQNRTKTHNIMPPERRALLRYWATLNYREKKLLERGVYGNSVGYIEEKRGELREKMRQFGDLPKSWRKR